MLLLEERLKFFNNKYFFKVGNFLRYLASLALLGLVLGFIFALANQYYTLQPSIEQAIYNLKDNIVGMDFKVLYILIAISLVGLIILRWPRYIRDLSIIYFFFSFWLILSYKAGVDKLIAKQFFVDDPFYFYVYSIYFVILAIIISLLIFFARSILFIFKDSLQNRTFNWGRVLDHVNDVFSKPEKIDYDEPSRLSDKPLQSIDQIEKIKQSAGRTSLFNNFDICLENIKRFVNDNQYSNSICVDACWGSGKTSLIKILKTNLIESNNPREIVWIDFDPWDFGNSSELVEQLFKTINKRVKEKYYLDLQPDLGPYIKLVTPAIESLGLIGKLQSSLFRLPFLSAKSFPELKDNICKKLDALPGRIIIVIDDIDRLEYEEAITVIRMVRMLSDFPNILFILPFDYDRISALIQDKKGHRYAGFISKIINSRIKMEQYSYDDLESIFIYSIGSNSSDPLAVTFRKLFDYYVTEKSKLRFKDIKRRQDEDKSEESMLKPMFSFVQEVFQILYPEYTYPYLTYFVEAIKQMETLISLHLASKYENCDSLARGIVGQLSKFKKDELFREFKKMDPEITSILIDPNGDQAQKENTQALWENFKNSLATNMEYSSTINRLDDIKKVQFIADSIQTNNDIKGLIEQIGNLLSNYKGDFEENAENMKKIKNWLVEEITPRQIKEITRRIKMNGLDPSQINNSMEEFQKIVLEIASMQ